MVSTTPEELPSFRVRGQAPSSLHRIRRSFRRRLIDWRYRFGGSGRSRTFTGQCRQPFCPGDSTSHSDGPSAITKYRPAGERNRFPRLRQVRELGLPPEPKRDASRTVFTWPLRRRSLPPDAGYIPSFEVRVKISVQARTRTGRIRFHPALLSVKISPFTTKPTTPAAHA